jgi:outer membrane protein assembly factor BamD
MHKKALYFLFSVILLSSCNSFDKLLKSHDQNLKYETAKKYYEQKKNLKAITLFEDIAPYYKGTDRSEEILYLTAKTYFNNKDYAIASSYFTTYTKTFPREKNAEESWYMIGYCEYQDSPDARLDQTTTIDAIKSFSEYLDIYPKGVYAADAGKYLNELYEKLAYKAYLNAKLYFNLGNYMGNNYLSAIITANNALKDYPNSKYKENLSFLILKSKFNQAEMSIESKKLDRYRETIDEYYNFISMFPNGQYDKEAQRIFKTAKSFVKE